MEAAAAAAARTDQWGYPVRTTSDACIAAIDYYYHQVLSYGRDRKVILEAAQRDPHCVLANVLAAHFLSSKKPSAAAAYLDAAASRLENATAYEKAVFRAVSCLLAADRNDEVAVQIHREVLPQNQQESYIYGMLAFPLSELGRMSDALKSAMKGFEINRNDIWSQHALCHVLQNDCRFNEAVDFMESCSSSWTACSSFMYTHNWWHVAVCYLEGHSPLEKVLDIYDHCIMKELERDGSNCEEVYPNALGLLLRISVRGQMDYIGDRLKIMADAFTNESNWHTEWLADLLALWALASTQKTNKAEDLLDSLKFRVCSTSKKQQHAVQRVILLAEALLEYGRANYHKVFDILGPNFDAIDYKMIGASDEQLDVFNEVWYVVLLNTGHAHEAIEAIDKKVRQREGAPFLWHLLARAYSLGASFASDKSKALEVAYFK